MSAHNTSSLSPWCREINDRAESRPPRAPAVPGRGAAARIPWHLEGPARCQPPRSSIGGLEDIDLASARRWPGLAGPGRNRLRPLLRLTFPSRSSPRGDGSSGAWPDRDSGPAPPRPPEAFQEVPGPPVEVPAASHLPGQPVYRRQLPVASRQTALRAPDLDLGFLGEAFAGSAAMTDRSSALTASEE